jgi:serine phosphatase RsbU (regulator of sigma subunit)
MNKQNVRVRSQLSPILHGFIVFISCFLIVFGVTYLFYHNALTAHKDEIREGLVASAKIISNFIDVEKHQQLRHPSQLNSELYKEVVAPLKAATKADPRIAYLYTIIKKDGLIHFIVDETPPDEDQVGVMEIYDDASDEIYNTFVTQKEEANREPYSDEWGTFFGASVPLFHDNGDFEGVLAIDLNIDNYLQRLKPVHRAFYLAIFIGLGLAALAGIVTARFNLSNYRFTCQLADANQVIVDLNEKLKEENLHLAAELDVAKTLQRMALPNESEIKSIPSLNISGYMEPADEVGGDYYDVVKMTDKSILCIGDVTGHGLESGVIMLMIQTAVQALKEAEITNPERMYALLNKTIYNNLVRMGSEKSMTLSVISYACSGEMIITGQHEDIILLRNGSDQIELIDTMELGLPIGLEQDISEYIASTSLSLNHGDILLFYTDGITEAENTDGEFYGMDRFCNSLIQYKNMDTEDLKQHLIDDLLAFIGKAKIFDDITLMVIKKA